MLPDHLKPTTTTGPTLASAVSTPTVCSQPGNHGHTGRLSRVDAADDGPGPAGGAGGTRRLGPNSLKPPQGDVTLDWEVGDLFSPGATSHT